MGYHMSKERQRCCEKRREQKRTSSINLGTPISTSRKNRNKSMRKQERINKYLSLKKEEQKAVTSRNMMVHNNGKNYPSRKKNLRVGEASEVTTTKLLSIVNQPRRYQPNKKYIYR